MRNVDRVWPDVPVPWPHLGAIVAVCYCAYVALICRFSLAVLGPLSRRTNLAINTAIAVMALLFVVSYEGGVPSMSTLALSILVGIGLSSMVLIVRETLRTRRPVAWVVTGVGTAAMAAGVYDLILIRIGQASGLRITLSQHALFLFVLIMAGLVVERFSRSVAAYKDLAADLARRVDKREQQLREAFDALRQKQHEQSVASERQRMMREIHDGVGSQLVGLLNMVTRPNADPAVLKEHVQSALDEMRMAVDSLQPVHDDLITVLATLRYRLQPRLEAAGIEVVWDVVDLPVLRQLSPQVVLNVQRILLEAFTNILKHARASRVMVQAHLGSDHVPTMVLRIVDNGVGLRPEAQAGAATRVHGHGIANMLARAAAIGAEISVIASDQGGVHVELRWPVELAPPAA